MAREASGLVEWWARYRGAVDDGEHGAMAAEVVIYIAADIDADEERRQRGGLGAAQHCQQRRDGLAGELGVNGEPHLVNHGVLSGGRQLGQREFPTQIDTVKPTVTYSGNDGTYGVLSTVTITCAAADDNSGVASSTCANVNSSAALLGAGAHQVSATATDKAGNTASSSTTYTVM